MRDTRLGRPREAWGLRQEERSRGRWEPQLRGEAQGGPRSPEATHCFR